MDVILSTLLEKTVPILILSFATPFISAFLIHYLMCKVLPNRLNIYGLLVIALIYTLWYNLRFPDLFGTGYHMFMTIFANLSTGFIVIFLFKGPFWKKFLVWWYFEIIKTLCQAVAYVPILLLRGNYDFGGEWAKVVASVGTDPLMKSLHTTVFISLFILFGFLSLAIWRRILMKKFDPFYILVFALPLGQVYSLSNVIHPNMGDWVFGVLHSIVDDVWTAYNMLSLFGLSMSLAASIAILVYILSYDKKAEIEAELFEARREMELEQAKFKETEERRDELEKVRHDFNNQLSSIIQLVRVGEDSDAQDIISALTNELNAN